MLLDNRSPAPLLVAPAALLDEQELPELKCVRARERANIEETKSDRVPHVFGRLPVRPESKEVPT
jgi:xanthosine utilization system XapX-like protein